MFPVTLAACARWFQFNFQSIREAKYKTDSPLLKPKQQLLQMVLLEMGNYQQSLHIVHSLTIVAIDWQE